MAGKEYNLKWTEAQLSAIETRDKNILVSAAAGSGKTAVLVERIKSMILADDIKNRVSVDEMLIVTFSNAAAAEMKEKIIKAINSEIQAEARTGMHSVEKIAYLKSQLNMISTANISTFHSFCMEVIRKYFYAIDVDKSFKICDEAQKTIMRTESLEEEFEELFDSNDSEFIEFLDKYSGERDENDVKEMISKTYDFIMSMPDPFGWLHEKVSELNLENDSFDSDILLSALRESVKFKLSTVLSLVESVRDMTSGFSSLEPSASADLTAVKAAYDAICTDGNMSYDKMKNAVNISFSRFSANKEEKEDYAEIKEDVNYIRKKAKMILKDKIVTPYFSVPESDQVERIRNTYKYARILEKLVIDFEKRFKAKKREKGVLDFNDLEHEALRALSKPEIAEEYRNKFKTIFIDEYQDSNYVQESLIDSVKRDNNVFMVGDVKQSIYKFRLAEPELFIEKYNRFRLGENFGTKIDLNMNFRSKKNIIDSVNSVFGALMSEETAGIDYDEDAALYKGIEYEGELDYPTVLHIMNNTSENDSEIDEEIKQLKSIEIEAVQAAKIVKSSIGKQIFDAKLGTVRKVRNSDVVILLRAAKRKAEVFASALNEEGIPTYVDQGDGYFETTEVEVFLNLLRVIDNKKQDIPLISVLYSPIFGLSAETLTDIRLASPKTSYYDAFEHYSLTDEKCGDIIKKLDDWRIKSSYMTLEDFIWTLIRETKYMDYVSVLPGSVQRCANLHALVDRAITFQSSKMKGLFSFVNYIELIRKNKVESAPVKLIGENDDVVRIMTIHKSKGLEFPIVLLAGLGGQFRKTQSVGGRLSFHNRLGISMRYEDSSEGFYAETLAQAIMNEQKSMGDIAEELRVLYVAFTRAQDQLILLGTLKDFDSSMNKSALYGKGDITTGNSFLSWLLPIIDKTNIKIEVHDRSEISRVAAQETEMAEHVSEMLRKALSQESPLVSEINRRMNFKYKFAGAVASKSKFSVSEINRTKSIEEAMKSGVALVSRNAREVKPLFMQGKKSLSSAEAGTAVHKVMEHIPFRRDITDDDVNSLVEKMTERCILSEEEAALVNPSLITGFLSSDIGNRACMAFMRNQLRREVPFTFRKSEIMIQGVIDCYFEEDDKLILIDYKTNYIDKKDEASSIEYFKREYEVQTSLYREALGTIEQKRVSETYLYSFYLGREIEIVER